jgi:hypothetical protein
VQDGAQAHIETVKALRRYKPTEIAYQECQEVFMMHYGKIF